jgi:transcriptional regulator with XRE-family HTH domain
MARTKKPPISREDRGMVGALLRELRRAAGFRSVEAAAGATGSPASRQTIYSYERGSLTPSLPQFLDLVEFYVIRTAPHDGGKGEPDLRAMGVAAVARALTLPLYQVGRAHELMAAMQPELPGPRGERR